MKLIFITSDDLLHGHYIQHQHTIASLFNLVAGSLTVHNSWSIMPNSKGDCLVLKYSVTSLRLWWMLAMLLVDSALVSTPLWLLLGQ